jgi:hypothetical protein
MTKHTRTLTSEQMAGEMTAWERQGGTVIGTLDIGNVTIKDANGSPRVRAYGPDGPDGGWYVSFYRHDGTLNCNNRNCQSQSAHFSGWCDAHLPTAYGDPHENA